MEKKRKNTGLNRLVTVGLLQTALRPLIDRLNTHDVQLQRIEENMATKDQLDQVIRNMDFVMRTIKKFDDERTFDGHRIGMLEETSKVHTHDIKLLKLRAGV